MFSFPTEDEQKPRVLWSLYFNQSDSSMTSLERPVIDHVEILAGPDATLHYGLPVEQVRWTNEDYHA